MTKAKGSRYNEPTADNIHPNRIQRSSSPHILYSSLRELQSLQFHSNKNQFSKKKFSDPPYTLMGRPFVRKTLWISSLHLGKINDLNRPLVTCIAGQWATALQSCLYKWISLLSWVDLDIEGWFSGYVYLWLCEKTDAASASSIFVE